MTYDWEVYSTGLATAAIMVRCKKSGAKGLVMDSTVEEWKRAFRTPTKPYPWISPERVRVTDVGVLCE